jgi:hypothetical protein
MATVPNAGTPPSRRPVNPWSSLSRIPWLQPLQRSRKAGPPPPQRSAAPRQVCATPDVGRSFCRGGWPSLCTVFAEAGAVYSIHDEHTDRVALSVGGRSNLRLMADALPFRESLRDWFGGWPTVTAKGGPAAIQIASARFYAASAPTLQCAPSESTNCASTPPKSCFFGAMLKSTPFALVSR